MQTSSVSEQHQTTASPVAAWFSRWRKNLVWLLVLACGIAGGLYYWHYRTTHAAPAVEYKTAPAEMRRIVGKVTASGTLQAVTTVQVGSQVSGRVQKLYVDFNSPVKKGELIAKIDPQLIEAAVAQSRANFLSAQASLTQAKARLTDAKRVFDRTSALHAQGLAAQQDVDTAETNLTLAKAGIDVANASLQQARASLNQTQVNLSYTSIFSPIDGTVISRNVDVGQTVAASLQAPVLFTIAGDLSKMQVDTNVSEGDVGRLEAGQQARFTVDAFPGRTFRGTIAQIRNAAQTLQNVVTYDAVIAVDNTDLKLRPGMTANVTIIYDQRDNALAVPNAALRFRMPGAASTARTKGAGGARPAGSARAGGGRAAGSASPEGSAAHGGHGNAGAAASTERPLWVMRGGAPAQVSVKTGLTDGTYTEITSGDLKAGEKVVTDATSSSSAPPPSGGGGMHFRL